MHGAVRPAGAQPRLVLGSVIKETDADTGTGVGSCSSPNATGGRMPTPTRASTGPSRKSVPGSPLHGGAGASSKAQQEQQERWAQLGTLLESDELKAILSDQPMLDDMKQRIEQAHDDAKRHESKLKEFQLEADVAQRAAVDAKRLQSELLQIQRSLASWVVEAVKRGREQREAHDEEVRQQVASAVTETRQQWTDAAERVVDSLGVQLQAAHDKLAGVATTADKLARRNETLLDSLSYFESSRRSFRTTLGAVKLWRERAQPRLLARVAERHWAATMVSLGFCIWVAEKDRSDAAAEAAGALRRSSIRRTLGAWSEQTFQAKLQSLRASRSRAMAAEQSSRASGLRAWTGPAIEAAPADEDEDDAGVVRMECGQRRSDARRTAVGGRRRRRRSRRSNHGGDDAAAAPRR